MASYSGEEVKEVKGLDISPYTSLQFLELGDWIGEDDCLMKFEI